MLFMPTTAKAFMYDDPLSFFGWVIRYFCTRELGISRFMARHFRWPQNVLWLEDLEVPLCPAEMEAGSLVLSGSDAALQIGFPNAASHCDHCEFKRRTGASPLLSAAMHPKPKDNKQASGTSAHATDSLVLVPDDASKSLSSSIDSLVEQPLSPTCDPSAQSAKARRRTTSTAWVETSSTVAVPTRLIKLGVFLAGRDPFVPCEMIARYVKSYNKGHLQLLQYPQMTHAQFLTSKEAMSEVITMLRSMD